VLEKDAKNRQNIIREVALRVFECLIAQASDPALCQFSQWRRRQRPQILQNLLIVGLCARLQRLEAGRSTIGNYERAKCARFRLYALALCVDGLELSEKR